MASFPLAIYLFTDKNLLENLKVKKLLFIELLLLGCIYITAVPEALASEGDILLSDNFNDGNFDGWIIESGQWWINSGNLVGAKSGKALGGRINSGNSEWDNYRIEMSVNGFQGIDQGVGFRYGNGDYYEVNLRYGTGIYDTPQIKLFRHNGSDQTLLSTISSFPLKNSKWYLLKIETLNENIKIWIDNTLIFDFTDTGTNVKKGTITLSYWTGDISVAYMRFDNVKVTALAPPPQPKLPVIFIPGIGGSEMKATQDIVWNKENGHGGMFSYAYKSDEKIWVNQDRAAELGNDDYFDVLRLKTDGITPEADLSLTGNLTSFGYGDIDSFFTGMGYVKNTNFFIFPYDWRKDVRENQNTLDSLVEQAKTASGQTKVNLVVHSMGGLIAHNYIANPIKAAKVNKLIELGVPHLGTVDSLKTLRYGSWLGYDFRLFMLGIPPSETKDVSQNLPSFFELMPSSKYYDFYSSSYPFKDDRDIDSNKETGALNFNQLKTLLTNLGHNMTVFDLAKQFHDTLDPTLNQTNNVKLYEIVGSGQPTLGQIHETWWITWPINLIPKTDEIFINGDDTVPLYSASLKSDSQDLSGAFKIYYVDQKHSDLVSSSGTAMRTVRSILDEDNSLPVEVKDMKISLEGQHISVDQDADLDMYDENGNHTGPDSNGNVETNIPNTFYSSSGKTKHIFVKKSASKSTAKIKSSKTSKANVKIRSYSQDSINRTVIYNNVPMNNQTTANIVIDPSQETTPVITTGIETITATSEVTGSNASDQTAPVTIITSSGINPVTVTLTGSDTESGILIIEYSLDNGQTVNTYTEPFTISTPGQTTIQFKAIDKLGNEEIPQSKTIELAVPPSPTPTPSPAPTTTTGTATNTPGESKPASGVNLINASPTSNIISTVIPASEILGISFKNPSHIADQLNVSDILNEQENSSTGKIISYSANQTLSGLLIVTGGMVALTTLGLIITFSPWNLFFRGHTSPVRPFPK